MFICEFSWSNSKFYSDNVAEARAAGTSRPAFFLAAFGLVLFVVLGVARWIWPRLGFRLDWSWAGCHLRRLWLGLRRTVGLRLGAAVSALGAAAQPTRQDVFVVLSAFSFQRPVPGVGVLRVLDDFRIFRSDSLDHLVCFEDWLWMNDLNLSTQSDCWDFHCWWPTAVFLGAAHAQL